MVDFRKHLKGKESVPEVAVPQAPQAIAPIPKESLMAIPSYIPQGAAVGTEHITRDDVRMPRLRLAQALSPQLSEADPSYIDGLKNGDAFNDLTGQIYGKTTLEVIFVRADVPRWVEFDPDTRGVIDPNVPYNDPRTQFTTGEDGKRVPPVATKFYDYVVLLGSQLEALALSFKGTGIRTALRLNGLLRIRPVPIYAQKYILYPVEQKNDKGRWYVFSVRQGPFLDEEAFKYAESVFQAMHEKAIAFEREPEETGISDSTEEM